MLKLRLGVWLLPLLTCFLCVWIAPDVLAQDPAQSSQPGQQNPSEQKIEPDLLADGQQLAATGIVRDGGNVRFNLRVIIEIERQAGDVTFDTSRAADPVTDVQAAVIHRQAQFLDGLDVALRKEERAGVQVLFPLELQYMLVAEVDDLKTLRALAAAPGVSYLWKSRIGRACTVEGRLLTGSTTAANVGGWTGDGVGVAVLDAHFDLTHPELGGSTVLPNAVVKAGYNAVTQSSAVHSQTWGDCRHGTGVASILRRYAPDCDLYALCVFPAGSVIYNETDLIDAINWCIFNRGGAGGGAPIKLISMSLASFQGYASPVSSGPLHTALHDALANGIVCVAASGNDGWTNSMSLPAASTDCISVGATWDTNNAPYTPFPPANCTDPNRVVDERTCYSNTATFLDIYCPSEEVICGQCGGGTAALGGTSSATPAVAGLTAQLLHARPFYEGNLTGLVSLFQATGAPVTGDPTLANPRRAHVGAAIVGVAGNTGRTVNLLAPAVMGRTASFSVTSPASAAGNFYAILWSAPQFAGVASLAVPGVSLSGFIRVDPQAAIPSFTGLLGATGSVVHNVLIPNHPSWIGYNWDLQSADLETTTFTVRFSDNELALRIPGVLPPDMVPIAAGTFQMGSNAGQANEQPVHFVTISRPFWIGKYEVTQAEYQAVAGSNPSYHQGASWPNSASRPVERVSWNDAMAYCTALTAQHGAANRLPSGYQYRLPTEAEWEYCCRAGTTTEWNVGTSLSCSQANFGNCVSPGQTVVVGSYAANPWGLHDMHGNVSEWCLDWWDATANYPSSPVIDPYVTTGTFRLNRGGGWNPNSSFCRSARRLHGPPSSWDYTLGFRVVLAPVPVP